MHKEQVGTQVLKQVQEEKRNLAHIGVVIATVAVELQKLQEGHYHSPVQGRNHETLYTRRGEEDFRNKREHIENKGVHK